MTDWPYPWPLDPSPRAVELTGHLKATQIRDGAPRGPHGLRQRRAWPRVFGEPLFEAELVPESICAARPHIFAWTAWQQMVSAAESDGLDTTDLQIHSAYRPVALQAQIWAYRLNERRQLRQAAGLPRLPQKDLERLQMKWTAKPGGSAHHTGLALDLSLYTRCRRTAENPTPVAGKRTPAYRWLAEHAATFGFYPYLPEAWHWEYNPPGLVERIRALRQALAVGAPS